MVKTATRALELDAIDRLEEKLKLVVGMVERLKTDQAEDRWPRTSASRAKSSV